MLARFARYLRADALPNTGSLARDLLASERTFLAWSRTGLGLIALGVALEKVEAFAALSPTLLHLSDSRTKLAAAVLVGSGSLTVVHGTARYFGTLRLLQEGKFRPNTGGVTVMAAACVGIAIAGSLLVLENENGRDGRKGMGATKSKGKNKNKGTTKTETETNAGREGNGNGNGNRKEKEKEKEPEREEEKVVGKDKWEEKEKVKSGLAKATKG